jgi:hypothetical protein
MTVYDACHQNNYREHDLSIHTRAVLAVLRCKPRSVAELFDAGFSSLVAIDRELHERVGLRLVVTLRAEKRP